jgi:uracil-DNA glycosylase family 4
LRPLQLIQEGPRDAKVIIVGESPGKKEWEEKRPFIGGSGEILSRGLNVAKIHRHECFITNICHIRPPKDEFEWFLKPQPKPELLAGIIQLRQDVSEIKPNLVIALGAAPLRILTGKKGITKWRGSILESTLVPGQKVISTFHPAAVLRQFDNHGIFQTDFSRFAEECQYPEIRLPKRTFYITPSPNIRNPIVTEMAGAEWLSIDIECSERPDGSWEVSCVGFSDTPDRALVIARGDSGGAEAIRILCSSNAKKIFQNGQFDISVLEDNGVTVNNVAWDTMYAHHAIFPECAGAEDEIKKLKSGRAPSKSALGKGLAFQTSIYTKEPYYKDDGKLWKALV